MRERRSILSWVTITNYSTLIIHIFILKNTTNSIMQFQFGNLCSNLFKKAWLVLKILIFFFINKWSKWYEFEKKKRNKLNFGLKMTNLYSYLFLLLSSNLRLSCLWKFKDYFQNELIIFPIFFVVEYDSKVNP